MPSEDYQSGEAYRDLQPGRSESCQGRVIPQTNQHSHCVPPNEDHLFFKHPSPLTLLSNFLFPGITAHGLC